MHQQKRSASKILLAHARKYLHPVDAMVNQYLPGGTNKFTYWMTTKRGMLYGTNLISPNSIFDY
jgi:hypothetical protein